MSLTQEDRRRGGLANPFTEEEAERGRAEGRRTMTESGHMARIAAKGRETMKRTRARESYAEAGRKGAAARWGRRKAEEGTSA